MTHQVLYRQKIQKTLTDYFLLQYILFKYVLFFWEKWIFTFYIPEGHILRRIKEAVDFKEIGRMIEVKYSG
ncbi:MAG: hypothetical protein AB1414_14630, partial [bacterium]